MQVAVISILCAVASLVAGGHIAAFPGTALSLPLLRTLPSSRGFAYSTTQYIGNPLPLTYYQFPQAVSALSPLHTSYYPFASPSYFTPAGAVYYPSPVAPILQQDSIASLPGASFPPQSIEQPAGDADTAVIDSADFPEQSTQQPSIPSEASTPTPPASTPQPIFPGFPSIPSIPQLPQLPSFPQFPSFPQAPSTPPPNQSAFPSADNNDKGLNDEDTISVESI